MSWSFTFIPKHAVAVPNSFQSLEHGHFRKDPFSKDTLFPEDPNIGPEFGNGA